MYVRTCEIASQVNLGGDGWGVSIGSGQCIKKQDGKVLWDCNVLGGSLVDQGLSLRLLDAGWKWHQKEGARVLKTSRTELMLEFSGFTVFEEGVSCTRAF